MTDSMEKSIPTRKTTSVINFPKEIVIWSAGKLGFVRLVFSVLFLQNN